MATVLVLGGTAWLGREVARTALARGHDVTCLARGESGDPPSGVRWVRADRTAHDAYDEVGRQDWDAVVDVSWQPGAVRGAVTALGHRAAHWTCVSSCSVYAGHAEPDQDETAPTLTALDADEASVEQYGEAKVACEQICAERLGDRLLVARSGLIAGYGDPSDRYGYWPARFAAAADAAHGGGPGGAAGGWASSPGVLVPDDDALPTQAVHVADLADWLVGCGERNVTGTMNASGDTHPLGEVLVACRAAAGYQGAVTRVPSSWLLSEGVEEYMGARSLPLWIVDPEWAGFSARDTSRARQAGLVSRPLGELVEDCLRWERERGLDRERRAGLTPEQEQQLLADWSSGSP